MKDLLNELQLREDFYSFSPVSDDEISEAEQKLKLNFSSDYRYIVASFGAISVNGHELTGICKANRLNVVDVTNEEKQNNIKVTQSFYVIEQTHIDSIVVWQDNNGKIYQTSGNSEPALINLSLKEYLLND